MAPADIELAPRVATVCDRYGNAPPALIEILHDLQDLSGTVPEAALPLIAANLNLSRAEVHGVASFYRDFREATGANRQVRVCLGEACRSRGAQALLAELQLRLADDPAVSIDHVYCLGNCALSPATLVDGALLGRSNVDRVCAALGAHQ